MTKRKANPLSRAECCRRAGLATAKSPRRCTPFKKYGDGWTEATARKGGLATARRHPELMRENARKGGLAKKPNRRKSWRHM